MKKHIWTMQAYCHLNRDSCLLAKIRQQPMERLCTYKTTLLLPWLPSWCPLTPSQIEEEVANRLPIFAQLNTKLTSRAGRRRHMC